MNHRTLAGLLASLLLTSLMAAAEPPKWSLRLQYGDKKVELSESDFAKLKPTEVVAEDDGLHHFRGVAMRDLLRLVEAPPGGKLRRPTLCLVARVRGADGMVCAFALAEFEEGFTDRTIILANAMDGAPLPADVGPWRLIAPKDTRVARWVRQAVAIEVISIENDAGTGDAAQPATAAERAGEHIKFAPKK